MMNRSGNLKKAIYLLLTASLLTVGGITNTVTAAEQDNQTNLKVQEVASQQVILQFMKNNPNKSSLYLSYNNKVISDYYSSKSMHLASTSKIIVAITYAKQAAEGKINPKQRIPLTELDKYYIPNLDGGAQPNWMQYIKDKKLVQNGTVSLEEVAKGMIVFSSNANTQYLMERLTLGKINQTIQELGLKKHEPIYPIYTSALIPYEVWKTYYSNETIQAAMPKIKKKLHGMTLAEYRSWSEKVYKKLMQDKTKKYMKEANIFSWFDAELDRMFTDRFTSSTTNEYVSVIKKLNNRSYYSKKVYTYLIPVMEQMMQNPGNQKSLLHAGTKGGSSAYILTQALYATDKKSNKTEIAIFFNNLTPEENKKLQPHLNQFHTSVLYDAKFREELKKLKGGKPVRYPRLLKAIKNT